MSVCGVGDVRGSGLLLFAATGAAAETGNPKTKKKSGEVVRERERQRERGNNEVNTAATSPPPLFGVDIDIKEWCR